MHPKWVRWTVIAMVVLLALALAFSAVIPAGASPLEPGHDRARAAARVHLPPAGTNADYQLGGAYPPGAGYGVVVRDRTDAPARGRYNVCYVNGFQTQPGELAWWRSHHPRLLLHRQGRLVRDPGWPDEVLLDTRTAQRRVRIAAVLGRWVAGCARDGYDAVEPDNLDSFTRSRHLLTRADNVALARRIVAAGHRHGLAVAQKNTDLTRAQVARAGFDFAVAEDCQVYAECSTYRRLYHRHVIEIEYSDEGRASFRAACRARGDAWPIVYRDRDLRPRGHRGYVRAAC